MLTTESIKVIRNMSPRRLSTIAFLYNKQYGQVEGKRKVLIFCVAYVNRLKIMHELLKHLFFLVTTDKMREGNKG